MSYLNILQIAKSGKISTFGQEIEDLFQNIIDKRDSVSLDRPEARNRIVEEMFDILVPEFSKVIKKHTNLDVEVTGASHTDAIMMCIQPTDNIMFDRDIDTNRGYRTGDAKPTTVKDLIKISQSIVDYYVPNPEQYVYKYFKFQIVIDSLYLFNRKILYTVHNEDLTAKEATALMLHEIYHALDLLKKCGETKFRLHITENQYSYFIENSKVSEKIELIKSFLVAEQKKSQPNKKVIDSVNDLLEMINKYDFESLETHSNLVMIKDNILDLVRVILASTLGVPSVIIASQLLPLDRLLETETDTPFTGVLGGEYADNRVLTPSHMSKIDDLPGFKMGLAATEMACDAFVAKHGYSVHFITGFNKLYATYGPMSKAQNKSKFAYTLSSYLSFVLTYVLPEVSFDLYEDIGNRLNSVRLNTIKELKQNFKNPHLFGMYLNSLKDMEKHENDIQKKIKLRNSIQAVYKFWKSGWSDELNKLMKHIQTLQNNDLYISAAKLQQMSNED